MKQLAVVAVLLLPATALAANLDPLIAKVVDAYGGGSAWAKVKEVRATGRVVPAMRKGDGKMTRTWRSTDNFRVEIAYPDKTELRALEDGKGTNNGRASNPMELDAMRLQAARLALPLLLAQSKGTIRDLGTHDDIHSIEIVLDAPLTMTVDIDPATGHIVRSVGKSKDVSFATSYGDFRKVNGLLMPFHEENSAMGMKTADIFLDKVDVVDR